MFSLLAATAAFGLATSKVGATTWQVSVGDGALRFEPPLIANAAVGDIINFTFHPKAHSVTQSSFASPCSPLSNGFDSGLTPVAANQTALPSFQVTVNDTNPVWVYCKQPGPPAHCGQGMVFAANTNQTQFTAFQAAANATATNSTSSASSSASSSAASAYVTPPPPVFETVTVTITEESSTWTTTYASYDGTPEATKAVTPQDHQIIVGDGGKLAFNPPSVAAAIGDTVTFSFRAKNHSVTESSFEEPCVKLAETSSTGQIGFNSGFMPVNQSQTSDFPTFQITINDTAPIWGYCMQTVPVDHCGSGMVFAINAVESGPNNFSAFQALAEHINGTSSAAASGTSGGSSPASSSKSGAPIARPSIGMAGIALALGAFAVATIA